MRRNAFIVFWVMIVVLCVAFWAGFIVSVIKDGDVIDLVLRQTGQYRVGWRY